MKLISTHEFFGDLVPISFHVSRFITESTRLSATAPARRRWLPKVTEKCWPTNGQEPQLGAKAQELMREHQLGIGEVEAANPDGPLGSDIIRGSWVHWKQIKSRG
jgi:hypothetical protein